MKPWREVITPRREILSGDLDLSLFAADLSSVVLNNATPEYGDPATFFSGTYLTAGLRKLLAAVGKRLMGREGGEPVVQLQTPFGGGKTHSLLALYHLFRSPQQVSHLDELHTALAEEGLSEIPRARVITFVGTVADPLEGRTPWGELAHQLGRYERVKQHDLHRVSPGRGVLAELLEGEEPTLILMDELAEYAVRASRFRENVMTFCQELSEQVAATPRAVLVVTLPSSVPYDERGEEALHQLQTIFGRVEAVYTPVQVEEVYEVIRRRLFQGGVSTQEVKRTAEAYWQYYCQNAQFFPDEAHQIEYRERIIRSYPFHPLLIDTLYEQWSTYPNFQRTRGALRLLALIVADLYRNNHSAPLIQPSHLNLAHSDIRNELVKHIGTQFEAVISADIVGNNAQACRLDEQLGSEYQKFRLSTAVATAIFFGSFSAAVDKRGISLQKICLAVLNPEIPTAMIGDTVNRLEEKLWYLHSEGGYYSFLTQPNIIRMIIGVEGTVKEEELERQLQEMLQDIAGKDWAVRLFPYHPQDVPDTKRMQLVVLAPKHTYKSKSTQELLDKLFTRCGETFRVYRNTVVALVPDGNEMWQLLAQTKRLTALQKIQNSPSLYQQLGETSRKQLVEMQKRTQDDLADLILKTYRHLAKPGGEGIKWMDLGFPTIAQKRDLVGRVREYLQDKDLLVTKSIAPKKVLELTLPSDAEEKPVRDVVEAFLRYPDMPMLEDQQVVLNALCVGAMQRLFSLRDEDTYYFSENTPPFVSEEWFLSRKLPAPAVTLGAEDIVPLLGKEQVTITEVYQQLFADKGKQFPDEGAFRQAFVDAVNQGVTSGMFHLLPEVVSERLTWNTLQDRRLVLPVVPPPPPQPLTGKRNFTLHAGVSPTKLSQVLQYIIQPLHNLSGTVDLKISLRVQTAQDIPEATIRAVDETLLQINAEILEKQWE